MTTISTNIVMYVKQISVLIISLLLDGTDKELPTVWIFPYFMEPHLKAVLPSLTMLDYKVLNLNCIRQSVLEVIFRLIFRSLWQRDGNGVSFCSSSDPGTAASHSVTDSFVVTQPVPSTKSSMYLTT